MVRVIVDPDWHAVHAESLIEMQREAELLALAVKHLRRDEGVDLKRMLERAEELVSVIGARLEEMI